MQVTHIYEMEVERRDMNGEIMNGEAMGRRRIMESKGQRYVN